MAKYETCLLGRYAKGSDPDGFTYGQIVFTRLDGTQIIVGLASVDDGAIDEYYTNEITMFYDRDACVAACKSSEDLS